MSSMKIIAGIVVRIDFECRDIGYGVESGSIVGYWNGEIDCWGKYTIVSTDGAPMVYLFEDEFVDVEPINEIAPFIKAMVRL